VLPTVTVRVVKMSMIPFHGSSSLSLSSVPALLRSLPQLAEWVSDARREKLAFRQAVSDHEAANTLTPSARPYMPSNGRGGGSRRGRKARAPLSSGSSGYAPTNTTDLAIPPPINTNVPQRVPRSVAGKVTWDVVKVDTLINAGTALSETNFSASLNSHPQVASWTALFDQWTIPQFSVTFYSVVPPGLTTSIPRLYSALDFDNANAISTVTAIEDYSSCAVMSMEPGRATTRTVRPCTKPSLIGSTSGVGQSWVDSGTPATTFYGIRSILGPAPAAITPAVQATLTIWFCFRNQI